MPNSSRSGRALLRGLRGVLPRLRGCEARQKMLDNSAECEMYMILARVRPNVRGVVELIYIVGK